MNKLLLIAFIEGGLVMLLELASPSLATPIWGNSIFIWAIMLSLAVGALAIGYFLGGIISEKSDNKICAISRLFMFSTLSLSIGIIFTMLINSSFLTGIETSLIWIVVLAIAFIPLVLFGATTPLIIAQLSNNNNAFIVGKVYSYSTYGGIVFALLTGFFLLPSIGLMKTLIVALFLLVGVILLLKRIEKVKRVSIVASIATVVVLVLYNFGTTSPKGENFKVLSSQDGINGHIMVADLLQGEREQRILFINRMGQTWVNKKSGFSVWSYPTIVTILGSLYPKHSKSLVLGLGGGIVAKQLREINGHRVDAVELDRRIIGVAEDFFQLPSAVEVYNEDARTYLNRTEEEYKFILFDIFNGEIAPSHTLSVEAFKQAKNALSKDGIIVINFNGFETGTEGKSSKALLNTLREAGLKTSLIPTIEEGEENRNNLYIAYTQEPNWEDISMTLNTQKGKIKIKDIVVEPKFDLSAPVISDDYPIMEKLNYPAAKSWRKSYYKNFTTKYKKQESIPFFF